MSLEGEWEVAYVVKVCWKSTSKTHQGWEANTRPWGDYSFLISFLSITYIISFDIHPDFSNLFGVRVDYNLLDGKWMGRIYSSSITYMDTCSFISVLWGFKKRHQDNVYKTFISSLLNSVLLRVKFIYSSPYPQTSVLLKEHFLEQNLNVLFQSLTQS